MFPFHDTLSTICEHFTRLDEHLYVIAKNKKDTRSWLPLRFTSHYNKYLYHEEHEEHEGGCAAKTTPFCFSSCPS